MNIKKAFRNLKNKTTLTRAIVASAFVVLCIAGYMIPCRTLGFSEDSPLYTHITYIFSHANPFHLLSNLAAYACVCFFLIKINRFRHGHIIAFTAAIAASFFSQYPQITAGASGVIYAAEGYVLAAFLSHRFIFISMKYAATFFFSISLSIIYPFIAGIHSMNINNRVHILSLVIALGITLIYYAIIKLKSITNYEG